MTAQDMCLEVIWHSIIIVMLRYCEMLALNAHVEKSTLNPHDIHIQSNPYPHHVHVRPTIYSQYVHSVSTSYLHRIHIVSTSYHSARSIFN